MRKEAPESTAYLTSLEPRRQAAVKELTDLIHGRYPSATFTVAPGEDDPSGTYVTATVDLDDPDEVVDLVIERMLALQIDEGIPIYVVPIRTPDRVAALQERQRKAKGTIASLPPLVLP